MEYRVEQEKWDRRFGLINYRLPLVIRISVNGKFKFYYIRVFKNFDIFIQKKKKNQKRGLFGDICKQTFGTVASKSLKHIVHVAVPAPPPTFKLPKLPLSFPLSLSHTMSLLFFFIRKPQLHNINGKTQLQTIASKAMTASKKLGVSSTHASKS